MAKNIRNEYRPDMVSPPGETLEETLDVMGMSQSELAVRMDQPVKMVNELVSGRAVITLDTALQLERALGISAQFWLAREHHYREWRARNRDEDHLRYLVEEPAH